MPEPCIYAPGCGCQGDCAYDREVATQQEREEKIMPARAYMPQAKSQEWETPRDLFDKLWDEFGGFDLDPCCQPDQYTAQRVLKNGGSICVPTGACVTEEDYGEHRPIHFDGLSQPWHGKVYMNPRYGAALREWVPKAVQEVELGNAELVVALLPSRTDVRWWQEFVLPRVFKNTNGHWYPSGNHVTKGVLSDVRFLGKRLKFGGAKDSATFPSAIVVWRK